VPGCRILLHKGGWRKLDMPTDRLPEFNHNLNEILPNPNQALTKP
jgi:hypothetical protein